MTQTSLERVQTRNRLARRRPRVQCHLRRPVVLSGSPCESVPPFADGHPPTPSFPWASGLGAPRTAGTRPRQAGDGTPASCPVFSGHPR